MKVNLRIKPASSTIVLNENEISLSDNRTINLNFFSAVFTASVSQPDLYSSSEVQEQLSHFKEGYATTILAYGQTGSGKTYTILGAPGSLTESNLSAASSSSNNLPKEWGLFPRIAAELVKDGHTIIATAIEVYFEDAFDLCNDRAVLTMKTKGAQRNLIEGVAPGGHAKNLKVHPSSCYCRICYMSRKEKKESIARMEKGNTSNQSEVGKTEKTDEAIFSLQGETRVHLKTIQDIVKLARLIEIERTSKSHDLNSTSSRSHCIITLQIQGILSFFFYNHFLFIFYFFKVSANASPLSIWQAQKE
jgi:hypothetical protein